MILKQLTLAMAKGRTDKESLQLLEKANIIFYSADQMIKMIYVKAIDITTYVEEGAADIGIVGRDNILEAGADIYELLDLKLGECRFVVASLKDITIEQGVTLKVASKYPN